MKQYQDLITDVLENGTWQENRTGVRTLALPAGAYMRFDLKDGFPAITTRKLAFKYAMGELCGFLRGLRSAADFRALGSTVWDQNANENEEWLKNPYREGTDDMGPVYGVQWRGWDAFKVLDPSKDSAKIVAAMKNNYTPIAVTVPRPSKDNISWAVSAAAPIVLHKKIDQLRECLDKIMFNPTNRRILFHGWNPATLDEVSLPACHLLYQFIPNTVTGELSMCMYVRSNDIGLGLPFNIAEGAALLYVVARLTGYKARFISYIIGDAHIYENHIPMVKEVLTREPYRLPTFHISSDVPAFRHTGVYEPEWLEKVEPRHFNLFEYRHHDPIKAPMAV